MIDWSTVAIESIARTARRGRTFALMCPCGSRLMDPNQLQTCAGCGRRHDDLKSLVRHEPAPEAPR